MIWYKGSQMIWSLDCVLCRDQRGRREKRRANFTASYLRPGVVHKLYMVDIKVCVCVCVRESLICILNIGILNICVLRCHLDSDVILEETLLPDMNHRLNDNEFPMDMISKEYVKIVTFNYCSSVT